MSFQLRDNLFTVKGRIVKSINDNSIYVEGLLVVVKNGKRTIYSTHTNEKGNFEFVLNSQNVVTYDIFCQGVGLDTLYLGSLKVPDIDKPELSLSIPIKVHKNFIGNVICPKCKKSNLVCKIRYGDGLPSLMKISSNGDTTYTAIYKGYYNAGSCIVEAARYYCDRDKIKF